MLCKWLKKKLKPSKSPVLPTVKKDKKLPSWYVIALGLIGIEEILGDKHNSIIVDFFKVVVGKAYPDEVAWCAAFVGTCLNKAGYNNTGSLTARSYLRYGIEVEKPEIGDIVIMWRDNKNSWKGHVGFYAGEGLTHIKVLGGNQNNKVSIAHYPKNRLLGYRRPNEKA